MFAGLEEEQLQGAVEALLFVTDEPLSTITMADTLQVRPLDIEGACISLREKLINDDSGIQLREVAGGWQLCTHPAYHELLENYVLTWDTSRLSQAALEVLSIVAYAQPVTRQGIAGVRGVNSDSSLNSLIEKGLVREVGVESSPGNPTLYATSKTFLEKFGLNSLDDLPELSTFAPDDETREFIATRLSATRGVVSVPASLEDESVGVAGDMSEVSDAMSDAMHEMMNEALATAAGAVEKIDFDDLEFEE